MFVEEAGHGGQIVSMLRDARENINWQEVDGTEPDAVPVALSDMPPSPETHPEWDYHRWVLSMSGWEAFYGEDGQPIQSQVCHA